MRYIAMHYTKVNGRMYTPGEVVNAVIAPDKAERLVKLGALKEVGAPAYAGIAENDAAETAESAADEPERAGEPEDAEDGSAEYDEDAIPPPDIEMTVGSAKDEDEPAGKQKNKGGRAK